MDILVMLRDFTVNFIYGLPANITAFILRIGLLLVIAAAALFATLEKLPWRNVFTQVCVAFLAIVVSLAIPVNDIREFGKETLAFMVVLSLLCMLFLPNWLPAYLTPKLGNQLKLKGIIKNIMWGLFILQLILGVKP
jgi:hypothetical protein